MLRASRGALPFPRNSSQVQTQSVSKFFDQGQDEGEDEDEDVAAAAVETVGSIRVLSPTQPQQGIKRLCLMPTKSPDYELQYT